MRLHDLNHQLWHKFVVTHHQTWNFLKKDIDRSFSADSRTDGSFSEKFVFYQSCVFTQLWRCIAFVEWSKWMMNRDGNLTFNVHLQTDGPSRMPFHLGSSFINIDVHRRYLMPHLVT